MIWICHVDCTSIVGRPTLHAIIIMNKKMYANVAFYYVFLISEEKCMDCILSVGRPM